MDHWSEVLYSLFTVYAKLRAIERHRNYAADHASTSLKAFFKSKKRSGTILPASFYAWFLKKKCSIKGTLMQI